MAKKRASSERLSEYRRKRDFRKTPEPPPEVRKSAKRSFAKARRSKLRFCVQKHLASHLHYDLRLEWAGSLLSWAVPKGPSLNPREKRLAMQVEDHPLKYLDFEGVIPEGYGAGIVMLWDEGTWEPEAATRDVERAMAKGELKFRLEGVKLKGSWVLVRTGGERRQNAEGQARGSWLLIKHRDEWAGDVDITSFAPKVCAGRGTSRTFWRTRSRGCGNRTCPSAEGRRGRNCGRWRRRRRG